MRKSAVLAAAMVTIGGVLIPAAVWAQMVIVVRHAERADGGAPAGAGMAASSDPELSAAGRARAEKLAAMLADAGVTAIYVTEFKRTQDTAKPLAAKLGITVELVANRDSAALIAKIKAHKTGAVLVIGHSNTVPEIIKALGGPAVTVADNEYDNIFIVSAATGQMTRIRFAP